jgi:hypothetical protein
LRQICLLAASLCPETDSNSGDETAGEDGDDDGVGGVPVLVS